MSPLFLRFAVVIVGITTLMSYQTSDVQQQTRDLQQQLDKLPIDVPSNLTKDPLTFQDQRKIAELTTTFQASEWLGPLAPIAISPFFGIAILAGLSQFGGDYLPFNSFISDNPVLGNPAVFWIFLCLTIATSLPRLTKVSKPAAQAIDQLEAYAGIITIVLIRLITMVPEYDPGTQTAMVVQMGALSFTADILFSIAATINIIVINSVKSFFEMLVWLIPFPMVDAMLEVANKSLCAGLLAIYAWSPIVATIINLILFIACLFAFRWIHRQVVYFRSLLFDPIWSMISKSFGIPKRKELIVFPKDSLGPFPAKSKLLMHPTDDGWMLTQDRWFLPHQSLAISNEDTSMVMRKGMLINNIEMSGNDPEECGKLLFSRRYSGELEKVADLLDLRIGEEVEVASAKLELS